MARQTITPFTSNDTQRLREIVSYLLEAAKQKGATAAAVSSSLDTGFSLSVRLGEVETLEFNRDKGVSIAVYFGQQKGTASTSDTGEAALNATLQAACDIADVTAADEYAGLADSALMATDYPDLSLYHPWVLSTDEAIDLATRCEKAGQQADAAITNSEGADVTTHQSLRVYGNTHGFLGYCESSRHSMSCVLVAGAKENMQRDYYYTVSRYADRLLSPEEIGMEAAKRTVARLHPQTLTTREAPVIFQADLARTLFSSFISAISGGNLYRQTSFLLDHLGKTVFPEWMQIDERPHVLGALGSAPFDAEGVRTEERDFIKDGILESYVLSSYSARKLGMKSTGHASGIHNLYIQTQDKDLPALLKEMDTGLLVTDLMGHGTNMTTGDFSHGASGFWIEKGMIQYPVEGITIAGNLKIMFQQIIGIANDIDQRGSILTGSTLIESMMIAGR